uniref:Sestrin-1 isoform X2 n=1 Tax=Geotrypetes seraphini TaxID=260995 RepID=A0A6P8Q9P4_GEOSA|nr:sestrin-1 isoform X2 [Geotrypetes seraphini]
MIVAAAAESRLYQAALSVRELLCNGPELGIQIPRPLGHGPSRFIPEKEILQVGTEDVRLHTVFADALAVGHLDNITLVMAFHPQYLESFLKTQHYLLQMDGPLPLHFRHYIGIMAAARHQCSYLVNLHVNDFLHVGGDPKWLNGLENAPLKLQNLGELNKMLAHRPWLIAKEHIEKVLKTGEHNSWSLAELIHAMVLLTHYHSLASFTFGCGISPKIHCAGDHSFQTSSVGGYCICDIANGNHRAEEIPSPTGNTPDYSWEDHGFSLVNRLYPDVGQLLDEKFHIAYNLTYNTMAMHTDVDTSMLRRAIWNYIHCMFGIRYDDYDYGEINQLLDRSFKIYIKTVVCSPEKTTRRMYDGFWRQFKHSEKVHVNLLLMEARMQAALLYALRAITHYMT